MYATSSRPQRPSGHFSSPRTATAFEGEQPVYFFLDFSNIAISAGNIAMDHGDSLFESTRVRLHAENWRRFVQKDRRWQPGFAAAGLTSKSHRLKEKFNEQGVEFEIYERGGTSGREQGVDQIIQGEMRKLLAPRCERGVVALATGDGNDHTHGGGFRCALEDLLDAGYSIEVMAWRHSFNSQLRGWASTHGEVVELDAYFHYLTFVEGGRSAKRFRSWYRRASCN